MAQESAALRPEAALCGTCGTAALTEMLISQNSHRAPAFPREHARTPRETWISLSAGLSRTARQTWRS